MPRVPGSSALSGRSVATDRVLLRRRGPGNHRDPVRRRQRLSGDAWQRRGGPRQPQPRHLHQRLPRDVADPAPRGGLRPGPGGPDHRQRPRHQDHAALRGRRAAAAVRRRHHQLRAHPGLRRRCADPRPPVADARGQPGACALTSDGVLHPAPPGGAHLRGDGAGPGGTHRGDLPYPQPAGRPGRVPDQVRGQGRSRPAQGGGAHRAGPAAGGALGRRQPGDCWATGAPTPG